MSNNSVNRPSLKKLAISKIPLFASLSEEERTQLCDVILLKEFKKGDGILVSDQVGHDIMFVADGQVDVKRTARNGKEVILSRLGEGNFFGEIALLTSSTRSADVVAAEDCMILVLRASLFEELLSSNPRFVRALLEDLASRVAAASTRISDLALLDVYFRVYRTLCSLAGEASAVGDRLVKERPTHKELAAMVGTSREMITRALSKLEDDGVVSIEDRGLRILSDLQDC